MAAWAHSETAHVPHSLSSVRTRTRRRTQRGRRPWAYVGGPERAGHPLQPPQAAGAARADGRTRLSKSVHGARPIVDASCLDSSGPIERQNILLDGDYRGYEASQGKQKANVNGPSLEGHSDQSCKRGDADECVTGVPGGGLRCCRPNADECRNRDQAEYEKHLRLYPASNEPNREQRNHPESDEQCDPETPVETTRIVPDRIDYALWHKHKKVMKRIGNTIWRAEESARPPFACRYLVEAVRASGSP